MTSIDSYLVRPSDQLRRAAEVIDRNKAGIAVVVDDTGRLLGTITDGDLRRAILKGSSLDIPISSVLTHRTEAPITASVSQDRGTLLPLMQEKHIRQLPLVDGQGLVVEIVTLEQLVAKPPLELTAVVMAGGFGTRLRPLTDQTPKSLLPVGGKPMIELIVDRLCAAGVRRIVITTHYRAEDIERQLGNGGDRQADISYVLEENPLGTAGALSLISPRQEPLLVVNGDILTQLDYRALYLFHMDDGAEMTVTAREYHIQIPYGVIETDGVRLRSIVEKPEYRFFFAAGVYLLNPSALQLLNPGERCDMPVLISRLTAAGRSVATFPVREYWLDVGHLEAYEQAQIDHAQGMHR